MRIAVGICQLIVTIVFRFFFRLGRKVVCHHNGIALPKRSQPVLFVANHVHHLDPPAIFSSLPLPLLFQTAPIKFLSWWRYFWSPLLPIQLLTGCFPTHGPGHSGIDGMVYYATHGYRTFIFPHGKREKKQKPGEQPYRGVRLFLDRVPNTQIILVKIAWEQRIWRRLRPRFWLTIAEAPSGAQSMSPSELMDEVAKL